MITDHGGFDLLLEVSDDTLASLARTAFPISPITTNISLPQLDIDGQAVFTPTITVVQPVSGPALNITLGVGLEYDTNSRVGSVVIGANSDNPVQALVTANLAVAGLQVQATTPAGLNPDVSVDLSDDAGLTVILAEIAATSGTEAAEAAKVIIEDEIASALINEMASLPALTSTLFTFPANLTTAGPATAPPLVIAVNRGALLIGVTLGGAPGNLAAVTSDNLREENGEAVAIVIQNRALLQDLVRPEVEEAFPLPAGGFNATHPFLWTGAIAMVNTDLGPINLVSVRASTAGPNRVVLDLAANGNLAGGAVIVNAAFRATATVGIAIVGGALTLTFTIGPIAVLNARADIAWWVYVAGTFGGGALLATAIAIVDLVADGVIRDEIAAQIDTLMFPNVAVALPTGLGADLAPGRVAMLAGPPRITAGIVEITNDLLLTIRND